MLKKIITLTTIFFMVGCNSNPPPTNAKAYKEESVNGSFIKNEISNGVIKQQTNDSWLIKKSFNDLDDPLFKNPEYYYLMAHADEIIIFTNNYDTYRKLLHNLILGGSLAKIRKSNALNTYSNAIQFKKDGVK